MRKGYSFLQYWNEPSWFFPVVVISLVGIVLAMQRGGINAKFPFSLIGLGSFFAVVYSLAHWGITYRESDARGLLALMFSKAKESILLLSGSLDKRAYLAETNKGIPVRLILEKAKTGVNIDIIVETEPDNNTISTLQEHFRQFSPDCQNRILRRLRIYRPERTLCLLQEHFMVVDGSWVRIEGRHRVKDDLPRRNRQIKHSFRLAALLEQEFYRLREHCQDVTSLLLREKEEMK